MAFFEKLSKKFEAAKLGKDKGAAAEYFDCTFSEERLGLTLGKQGGTGRALITKVEGEGAKLNIKVGDVIIGVAGPDGSQIDGVPNHDEFLALAGVLGRPLTLTLQRAASKAKGKGKTLQEQWKDVQAAAKEGFERQGNGKGRNHQPRPPPLTEEEKRAQRAKALAAAEGRTSEWDKKLARGRKQTLAKEERAAPVVNTFEASENEETKRVVQLVKQQEAETAARLGYNPYESRTTGHSEARAAITGGSTSPPRYAVSNNGFPGSSQAAAAAAATELSPEEAREKEHITGEVDFAIATVISSGEGDSAQVALQTALKMLTNMVKREHEAKFRRINCSNAAFQGKLGGHPGGTDVMEAAGFQLCFETESAYLLYPDGLLDPLPMRLEVALTRLKASLQSK
ncbi:unnamed protein product [Chrysoparadoxa australica]